MKWLLILAFYSPAGEYVETKAYTYQNKALCVKLLEDYKQEPLQTNAFGLQMRGVACYGVPVKVKPQPLGNDNDK
jgi:hypothetical protein